VDTDLVLTLGVVLLVLAIPSFLAAWSQERAPRIGAIMLVAAIGLILAAVITRPSGYAFAEVPSVMIGVFSRLID
jgi:formate-dependent nitrite reductase membrane component NrfD